MYDAENVEFKFSRLRRHPKDYRQYGTRPESFMDQKSKLSPFNLKAYPILEIEDLVFMPGSIKQRVFFDSPSIPWMNLF